MTTSSIGTAWIQIKPSLSGVSKDIENELKGASVAGGASLSTNLKNTFSGLGSNIQSTFSTAFSRVVSTTKTLFTAGLGSAIALLGSQLSNAFSRIDILNNAPKIFQAMGYAVGAVNKSMSDLKNYVTGLPTSLDSAIQGVETLSASFGGILQGEKAFKAVNDAGLAFNASAPLIQNAITQLSQTSLDGPLDAQTWDSLQQTFQPVFAALAKQSGETVGQLKKDFGAGGTKTVQDFLNQLEVLDTKGGAGMTSLAELARTSTGGIQTSFGLMKTAVTRSLQGVIQGIPNFAQSIQGVGKAIEGTLDGSLSSDKAAKLIDNFLTGIGGAFGTVITKLLPVILTSLTTLVNDISSSITALLNDGKNTQSLIEGFVQLFIAVAKAGGEIALAIIPLIPEIISDIGAELAKPENAGPIIAGMGVLLGYSLVKTLAGNLKSMAGNSISSFLGNILGKNKAADAAADSIDNLSSAVKRAPKSFTFGDSVASFFKNIGQVLSSGVQAVLSPLQTLASGVSKILGTVLTGAGQALAGFFGALANPELLIGVVVFAAAAGGVALAILAIGSAIGAVSPGLSDFLNDVIVPLGTFLLTVFIAALGAVTTAMIDLTDMAVIPLVDAVSGGLTNALHAISGVISAVGGAISGVVKSIADGIANVINSIARLLTSVGKQNWYATGYGITRNFSAGIIDGLIDFLQDSLNDIIDNLLNIPGIGTALKAAGLKKNPVNLSSFKLGKRAAGGAVFGAGSPTSDSIPMALSNGEYVVRAAAAQKIGYANLDKLNATGSTGDSFTMGDIIIQGYNKDPKELADEISKEIALRKARVIG